MSTTTIPPLTPDLRCLKDRANFEGISQEQALENFVTEKTGGVRTEVLDKLDARRAKAEAELAKIEDEKGRQLGLAAHRNALARQLALLRQRLERARYQCDLHRQGAALGLERAKEFLGAQWHHDYFPGDHLLGHLQQAQIGDAMEPLVSDLEAETNTKEAELTAFDKEHGIVAPAA